MLLSAVLILCMALPLAGQTGFIEERKPDEPQFNFDFATFRSEESSDQVTLEIYYKINNDGLQYYKHNDKFVASYEINVVVLGTDKDQVTGFSRERKYIVDSYKETKNKQSFLINQFKLQIPKGKFKIVCKLIDKLSGKVSSIEKDLRVQSLFRNQIDISGIEFVRATEKKREDKSGFDKGEKRIIPIVTRHFNGEADKVSFYVELYNDYDKAMDVTLKYKVVGERSKTVYKDELPLTLSIPLTRLIKEIPTETFVPDSYKLTIELKDSHKNKIAERSITFDMEWSLRMLVRNNYKTAVEQLRYIASGKERKKLKKLEDSPVEKRVEAFKEFWKSHDKYPETPENETMAKYYARMRHANEYFSVVNEEGWRTDRGRIYIIFGEPDHVEKYPFELSTVPYQIWYYYAFSRTFVFEDKHLTGDYYLTFPYDGREGGLHEGFEDFN